MIAKPSKGKRGRFCIKGQRGRKLRKEPRKDRVGAGQVASRGYTQRVRGFVYLLIILGLAYFLYTHQDIWRPKPVVTQVPTAPYAVKMMERDVAGAPYRNEVIVVNGDLWRAEVAGTNGKIYVALYDGTQIATNMGSPAGASVLDPHPVMNPLLLLGAKCKTIASFAPNETEQMDEHDCWKLSGTFGSSAFQGWVDTKTGFPVYMLGSVGGHFIEAHFIKIPIDFSKPETSEFFDPAHKEVFFGSYLK